MLSDAKVKYQNALRMQPASLLYAAPWWLDATCGADNWDVCTIKDQAGNELAFIPYYKSVIHGMRAVTTPPMTQWLPVMIVTGELNISLDDFLMQLPAYSILDISLKPNTGIVHSINKTLINLKYSFIISGSENFNDFKTKYNAGLRRNLKASEKMYTIKPSDDVTTIINLFISTYQNRNNQAPARITSVIPSVYDALVRQGQGQLEFAYYNEVPIAGVLTAWDDTTSYYLVGGRTGDDAGVSAHALLLDRAIEKAVTKGLSFDFEGSMHPGIANFFQSFGAAPEAYWHIKKFKGLGKLWAMFQQ